MPSVPTLYHHVPGTRRAPTPRMVRITISLTPCERGKTYATDAAERELRTSQHVMSKDDQKYQGRARASTSRLLGLAASARSEEHTSELQSRLHLVCRLLLEKKKTHARN